MGEPVKVGIIGCGVISTQYLATIGEVDGLRLVAVADLDAARAQAVADASTDVRALSVGALCADPLVDVVLNLTIPAAHAEVALTAIAAGKDVYGEKPLAATTAQARAVLDAAAAAGVRVGCAPDTVLGTGIQTARKAIDDGALGSPISASVTMMNSRPRTLASESRLLLFAGWRTPARHGPYYITSLITLLGPVVSVMGAASHTRKTRTIGTGPRAGEALPVTTDAHVTGVLVHESGVLSSLLMSFDAASTQAAPIEVHGDRASLVVPDPNRFVGDVLLRAVGDKHWSTLPVSPGYEGARRGYGLADMAATPLGDEPRARRSARVPRPGHHGIAADRRGQRPGRRHQQHVCSAQGRRPE